MLRASMRRRLPAVAFAVVLLAGAPCSDAATPKARAYLDTALTQMRAYSAYQPAEGWAAVTRTVHRRDARASTPRAEYDQLRYVLARLHAAGDGHAAFL